MWLYIHRPFEIWLWLAEMRIERVFMLGTLAVFFCSGRFALPRNPLNSSFLVFLLALLLSWAFSSYPASGEKVIEDFIKVSVLYVLIAMTCRSEKDLKFLVAAFLFSMALYMGHSFREYLCGRMVWRMGTARMIGVDQTYNDPNTFAATIVYSLPMLLPVWRSDPSPRVKKMILGYVVLALTCILLTGSRTAFVVLGSVGLLAFLKVSRKRVRTLLIIAVTASIAWNLLPEDRQNRYWTIIDPSSGPANAQGSADGRMQGFKDGMTLWGLNPLFGVGPGAFGNATGKGAQAHNLYGQVAGELGTVGVLAFAIILVCFYANYRIAQRLSKEHESQFLISVTQAILLTVGLLLVMGWGGHNLYRYTWMWYGAFQVVALGCLRDLPVRELEEDWEELELAHS